MGKYNVHIYAVVRVAVVGVEADSPVGAVIQAEESVYDNLHNGFNQTHIDGVEDVDFADHIQDYTVDTLDVNGNYVSDVTLTPEEVWGDRSDVSTEATCDECGHNFLIDPDTGVSTHVTDRGDFDPDQDASHVAYHLCDDDRTVLGSVKGNQ